MLDCGHSPEVKESVAKVMLHALQVDAGLLPRHPPAGWVGTPAAWATFTLPREPDDGLPWWFGPDYSPTPEAFEPPSPKTNPPPS